MLKELRKKSRRHALIVIGICAAIAIGLFFWIWNESLHYAFGRKKYLNELYDAEIKDMYVEADINFLMDYFATYTSDDKVTEKYYLLPVGEESYIAVECSAKYFDDFDQLMDISQDYMMGNRDTVEGSYHVKGTIMPLKGEALTYYKEYYEELSWGDSDIFLPYCLYIDHIGEEHYTDLLLIFAFILVFALAAIIVLVKLLSGGYEKLIIRYCKNSADYDQTMQDIENFYYTTIPVHNLRVSRKYIMAPEGHNTMFAESKELLWVYKHITEHRTYGIKTGETYALMLCMRDGIQHTIKLKKKTDAEEIMDRIHQVLPYVFLGYSDDIKRIYNKDRGQMIQEADRIIAEEAFDRPTYEADNKTAEVGDTTQDFWENSSDSSVSTDRPDEKLETSSDSQAVSQKLKLRIDG